MRGVQAVVLTNDFEEVLDVRMEMVWRPVFRQFADLTEKIIICHTRQGQQETSKENFLNASLFGTVFREFHLLPSLSFIIFSPLSTLPLSLSLSSARLLSFSFCLPLSSSFLIACLCLPSDQLFMKITQFFFPSSTLLLISFRFFVFNLEIFIPFFKSSLENVKAILAKTSEPKTSLLVLRERIKNTV